MIFGPRSLDHLASSLGRPRQTAPSGPEPEKSDHPARWERTAPFVKSRREVRSRLPSSGLTDSFFCASKLLLLTRAAEGAHRGR